MPGLFPRWSDTLFRWVLLAFVLFVTSLIVGLMVYVRTPYVEGQGYPLEQPVQFDHRHHVKDDGIECRYCHELAEHSAPAGVPATSVCMGCHSQIWTESTALEPVRVSFRTGQPIHWKRVHDLPDFVYFNHSVHVQNGVQCAQCHGQVEDMAVVYQAKSLTMGFCLDCHRHPERQVPGYRDPTVSPAKGERTAGYIGTSIVTNKLMTCTACHR